MQKIKIKIITKQGDVPCELEAASKPVNLKMGSGYYFNGMPIMRDCFVESEDLNLYFYKRKPEVFHIKNQKMEVIDDPVLVLSQPHQNNYSHFTLQCLGGYFLAVKKGIFNNKFKIIIDSSRKFQCELIKLFGIPEQQIITVSSDIIYKIPLMIASNTLFNMYVNTDYIDIYRQASEKINLETESIKLYITRRLNSKRPCRNEEEVISFFKKQDFEIADFDVLPVVAQIALVRAAKVIVAAHGASVANLAYKGLEPFKFVELFAGRVTLCNSQVLMAKNCNYSATVNETEPFHEPKDAPYKIDMRLLEQAMAEVNYKFEYTPEPAFVASELEDIRLRQHSLFPENYLLYLNAQDEYRAGHFAKVQERFEKNKANCDYKWHSALYLRTLFLAGDYKKFQSLTDFYLEKSQHYNWQTVAEMESRLLNWALMDKLRHMRAKDKKGQAIIAKLLDSMASAVEAAIYDWHFKPFCQEKPAAGEAAPPAPRVVINGNIATIFSMAKDQYISGLDGKGGFEYAKEPVEFKINRLHKFYFTIRFDNGFLSARLDGSYAIQPVAREWEYFFINPALMG